MNLSKLTLAAVALALAGTGAFAQTTVSRSVRVGPNGEVEHVAKRVDTDIDGTKTVHKVRRVETPSGTKVIHKVRRVTNHGPVVVHKKVVYHGPMRHHHHQKYAFTRHHQVHYASSTRPAHNNS